MRASSWWLIGLCLISLFVGLGGPAISESDEAFYAEAGREMVEGGDWLTPRFNYANRFEKPILFYWVVSAGYLIGGVTETAARAGSALAGVGLVLLTAWFARRTYDETTGLIAGAIVATSFGCVALARAARPEMLLAFLITAAIATGLVALTEPRGRDTRWWMLAAASAALAFLTKGPVGVAVPGLVLLPIVATGRRWRRLRLRAIMPAALVFLAIAAPWYALMAGEHGLAYLRGFFVGDNLERFATTRFNAPRSPFYYLPVVLGGMLPWTPFFLAAIPSAWRMARRRATLKAPDIQVAVWAALPFLLVSASVGKQAHYALPVLPPLSLLLARIIRDRLGADLLPGRDQRRRLFRAAGVAAGLLLAAVGAAIVRAVPLLLQTDMRTITLTAALIVLAGLAVAALALSPRWSWTPAALAAAAATVIAAFQVAIMETPGPDPVEQIAAAVASHRGVGEQVGTYRIFGRSLVFYTRVQQVGLYSDASVAGFLASPDRVLCVLPESDLVRLERENHLRSKRVAIIRYFDPATAKLRTLLWPDVSRDIQTAVIVSNR